MHDNEKELDTTLYKEIKQIIESARSKTYKTINFTMVLAYLEIGKRIVQEEQNGKSKAEYGSQIINELSRRLTSEFGKAYVLLCKIPGKVNITHGHFKKNKANDRSKHP